MKPHKYPTRKRLSQTIFNAPLFSAVPGVFTEYDHSILDVLLSDANGQFIEWWPHYEAFRDTAFKAAIDIE